MALVSCVWSCIAVDCCYDRSLGSIVKCFIPIVFIYVISTSSSHSSCVHDIEWQSPWATRPSNVLSESYLQSNHFTGSRHAWDNYSSHCSDSIRKLTKSLILLLRRAWLGTIAAFRKQQIRLCNNAHQNRVSHSDMDNMRGELAVAIRPIISCLNDVERAQCRQDITSHRTTLSLSRHTTAVDTVRDFKMLQRLSFAVCVLLVAASVDAKKLHKKSTIGEQVINLFIYQPTAHNIRNKLIVSWGEHAFDALQVCST